MRPILSLDRLIHLLMIVCRSSVASRTSIIGGICPQAPSRRHFTQTTLKVANKLLLTKDNFDYNVFMNNYQLNIHKNLGDKVEVDLAKKQGG